jgi:hypothetical protein
MYASVRVAQTLARTEREGAFRRPEVGERVEKRACTIDRS